MKPVEYTSMTDLLLFPLCVWRESSNQGWAAWRAVAHVVKNRVQKNNHEFGGGNYHSVILKPFAFSSFNHTDVNNGRWPDETETAWIVTKGLCYDVYYGLNGEVTDPTCGALFYWSFPLTEAPAHSWGPTIETLRIGTMRFCKPMPASPVDIRDATTAEN